MRAFEQSLQRLALPSIDIALIHDVDVWTHGDQIETRFKEAMDGAYRALDRLRGEKVVKGIGVGVNESAMCVRFANAGDIDAVLLAGRYSLLEQPALADFLPLAEKKRIGVMLGGVFNSGILATGAIADAKYNYRPAPPEILERVRRIEAVCAAHDVALPVAAMQFALGHPAVASLVIGAVAPAEVDPQCRGADRARAGRALVRPEARRPARRCGTGPRMIDAHQHFWRVDRGDYGWLTPALGADLPRLHAGRSRAAARAPRHQRHDPGAGGADRRRDALHARYRARDAVRARRGRLGRFRGGRCRRHDRGARRRSAAGRPAPDGAGHRGR